MKHGRFKRLTPQQVRAYAALRILGMMVVVAPDDARPLRALQRRGLVRYRRIEGVRYASPARAVHASTDTSGALRRRMARQPVACSASHDTRRR